MATTTFKKGQRFATEKKLYELNETMELSFEMMDVYYKGRKIDLRDYATYVEPFDEDAWYTKMAKKGIHFKAGVRLIFF